MIKNFLISLLATVTVLAYAQQETRIVVPYSPGGGNDTIARLLAKNMTTAEHPVIVENRPGANTTIGTAYVAKSTPDGRTLLLSSVAVLALSTHFMTVPPYNYKTDLIPVAYVGTVLPMVVAVNAKSDIQDVNQLIERAKTRTLNYGSPGAGNAQHVFSAMLSQITNTNMTHIPYKGQPLATQDLLSGQLDFMTAVPQAILPHVQTGKLRAIAVVADQPYRELPGVPTLRSLGYPQFAGRDQWFGVWAPAGTPPETVQRLRREIHALMAGEFKQELVRSFIIDPNSVPPAELDRDQNRISNSYLQLFRDYNIKQ